MKYHYSFVIRLLLLLIPPQLFSLILAPLTIYIGFLVLFNFSPVIDGNLIIINGIRFEFVEACIASYAYYFLWILCFFTKDISFVNRIKIIGYGFLLIFIMNIFRIWLIIYLALNYGFFWFNLVHLFFWKFLMGVYVALVWIGLVRYYKINSIPIYDDIKTLIKDIRKC